MYKTVRHGENSLQYTILPQQEEGNAPASAAEAPGGRGTDGGGRRKRRLPALLLAALLLAAGAATAAVVLPLGATGRLAQALPAALKSLTQHRSSNVTTFTPAPAVSLAAASPESLTEAASGDNQSATVDYEDTTTDAATSPQTSTTEPPTTVTEMPTTESTSTTPPSPPTPPPPPSPPPPLPTIAPPPDAATIATTRPCNTSNVEKWLPGRWPLEHLWPWKVRVNGTILMLLLVLLPLSGIVIASCLTWYVVRRRWQLRRNVIGDYLHP